MKSNAILIEESVVNNIAEICEFARAFADHFADDKPLDDDIEETDAQRLCRLLPIVERFLNEPKKMVDYTAMVLDRQLESVVRMRERKARESVNPNYKYCAVDCEIYECWLTDDIGAAMQKAHTMAVSNRSIWYVLKIYKAKDETYKTTIDCCYYDDGSYIERSDGDFLHFDFIAQKVGAFNIHKIV